VPSSDQRLRDDVHLLGDLLGRTLCAHEGEEFFALVEKVRALSKSARAGNEDDFDRLAVLLAAQTPDRALPVARAFAHFLNLANIAEQHHRVRRRREHLRDPAAPSQPGSCDEVLGRMLGAGADPKALYDTIAGLAIELVLTAHPTEVTRRTMLQKHRRVAELLAIRDRSDLTAPEEKELLEELGRTIEAAWETDEVRHDRPHPLEEVKGGLFIFEQTVWEALPRYVRLLDDASGKHTARRLPLDAAPVRFGSWIGGDRDGNPNVTADASGDACLIARWVAADLFWRELDALRSELSMAHGSRELESLLGGPVHEPYRAFLKPLLQRLAATRETIGRALETPGAWRRWPEKSSGPQPLLLKSELLEPLLVCYRSLNETGNAAIAEGRLLDLIRRAQAFGLTLVRLDIRQDSARHTALLDAITRAITPAADRGYAAWDEAQRVEFLLHELGSQRPLIPRDLALDENARADLDTFQALATIPRESLGAYVITMAGQPSDVLAVTLLQKEAGIGEPLRVVPLFETVADLQRAGATMAALFALPAYRARIGDRQEVMIGYSDSSKDSGRFTAAWELYKAQEQIVAAARNAGVELTLFHGRGGSVGRGGGPTYLAIGSQPPGSVDGRLRVTVQGEMIQAELGLAGIALRTLEVYTTATLDATISPPATPRPEWRALMDAMSAHAVHEYRAIVYDEPRFVEYFRTATPEPELGGLNIGSRPARRGSASSGVDSLRAIPWQFAWTQNRLLLPSWLGVDGALAVGLESDPATMGAMMRDWPFFRSTIELIEMVLAKAEPRIAAHYERLLVPDALRSLGSDLRARLSRTIELVLRMTSRERLLETNTTLRRSIEVRNPYVDPINLVQADILRRMRATADDSLRDAFVVTVNGIAAGMRNTG
jgi:phosphoenolpyruvate carboxylase